MRLLAISCMLPPILYPQAIQIGRLLRNCQMELVTVSAEFQNGNEMQGPENSLRTSCLDQIRIAHTPLLRGLSHRLALRLLPWYGRSPDEFVAWSRNAAAKVGQWLDDHPDAIQVMATFGEPMSDHLLGLTLKRRYGLPWLAHFSDPWSDNPFRRGQPLSQWKNRSLEQQVIKAADCLVFTSEETRQLVMRKYAPEWTSKSFVLAHSFDATAFPTNCSAPSTNDDDAIVLRYLGNFYGHRTPFPLIASLVRLLASHPRALDKVRVELIGTMSSWMYWHPLLRRLPEHLFTIQRTVPYASSLKLMMETDLLLVIDAPTELSVFLPSKLVDYIGSCKPILGIVPPGASQKLIAQLGGITAAPDRPEEIDAALLAGLEMARQSRLANEPWGASSVRKQYAIERIASLFRERLAWTVEHSCQDQSMRQP